ncbi:hypothetical protein ABID56_002575 [Alkalibacillus flavidus]|uniref:Uncharacterized protein n=1 Tax=Alkalibacillus flavidus TaxID=546021 RepID=A0ABV2KXX6_9BACI
MADSTQDDNIVPFLGNVKVQIKFKSDGRGAWSTMAYPDRESQEIEIDVTLDDETLKHYNTQHKNVIGKAISITSRAYEGDNYYVDRQLGIILTIHRQADYFSIDDIKPFDFYNPDGFRVEQLLQDDDN